MQIKKTYRDINPGLLYDELRDFILKQGVVLATSKLETYQIPGDSSEFTTRGTLTFKSKPDGEESIRAHLVGAATAETRVMIDIDEKLFPAEKVAALQSDLYFIFGPYEVKPKS